MQSFPQAPMPVPTSETAVIPSGKVQNKAAKDAFNREIELIVEGLKAQLVLSRYAAKAGKGTQEFLFHKEDSEGHIIQSNVRMDLGRSEFTELNHQLIERVRALRKSAFRLNKTTRRSNERSPGFLSLADVDPIMMNFLDSIDLGKCYNAPTTEVPGNSGRIEFALTNSPQETEFVATSVPLKSMLTFLRKGSDLYGKTNSGTLTTLFAIYRILNAENMIIPETGNTTASAQMRRPASQNGIRELLIKMIEIDIHEHEIKCQGDLPALQELAMLRTGLIASIDDPSHKVVSERFLPVETSKKSIFNPNSFKFSHFTKLNARATKKPAAKSAERSHFDSLDLKHQDALKEQTKAILIARNYHGLHNPRPPRDGKARKAAAAAAVAPK